MTGSLLTAAQVASLLGVPTSWVYEQSRAGRIPTVTLGRYRRYRREAIEVGSRSSKPSRRLAAPAGAVGKRHGRAESTDRVPIAPARCEIMRRAPTGV